MSPPLRDGDALDELTTEALYDCYSLGMGLRRPAPPDFDERVAELVERERALTRLQAEIDDLVIGLLHRDKAPTSTVAERLGITPQAMSERRAAALRRRSRNMAV